VVATDVAALPEVVGGSGLLVGPGSVPELTRALVGLARDDDLRRRLGDAGSRRAQRMFSLTRMVDATIDVYSQVVF
jgi:glycosyltransferase involved in cell wall biosynthesis